MQFENLIPATIVKRPSKVCKSPYMADITLDDTDSNTEYLAHSPSLGCSGNTDSGSHVLVSTMSNTKCKSSHKIQFSLSTEVYNYELFNTIVCTNPQIAENIIHECLSNNTLQYLKASQFKSQTTVGGSRFDFTGVDENDIDFIAEVKTVPIAVYHNVSKQEKKKMIKQGTYYSKHPNDKIAIFPDGYIKGSTKGSPKPQSERANKHILELTEIKQNSNKRAIMIYVIQRSDASEFRISDLDPIYKSNVKIAQTQGVELYAVQLRWTLTDDTASGSIIREFPLQL